ncbi:PQQ-dependent sugar dehydrogenase [Halovenus rubra]|uniref:PQQ-dependent sugar dehydrogenase n=2 Tax=Halovenus rubra TaxID=869890 RepID=A0ACC7DZE0_9EURY|nr:PQQ-dependent sugar dehydrogenase [Halovenus rubra]
MKRRQFLTATTLAVTGIAGCLSQDETAETESTVHDTPDTDSDVFTDLPDSVGLEPVASGLTGPLDVAFADGKRYIAEQRGTVQVHEEGGVRSEPLVKLQDDLETGGEKGLLGLAVHPEDDTRLFVRYSAPSRPGTPSEFSHTFVLSEFRVMKNGRSVDRETERTVLEIPQPQGNHNAGDIEFGPDGYLYVAVGDGGAGGDQGAGHVADWYDGVAGGNGQDITENLLGSILRIDVDADPTRPPLRGNPSDYDDEAGYAVPSDNPLVGTDGRDEQFAWGLRNPWRMAFDGTDLYAGDVGQSEYEEVDHIESGGNYGWNVREGQHCYRTDDCPGTTPEAVRAGEPLVEPVIEYPHSGSPVSGISVIGGNIYRGSTVPGLKGMYIFGDFRAGGTLFVGGPTEDSGWPTTVLSIADGDAEKLQRIRWLGRHNGEMYVAGVGAGSGALHRLVSAEK